MKQSSIFFSERVQRGDTLRPVEKGFEKRTQGIATRGTSTKPFSKMKNKDREGWFCHWVWTMGRPSAGRRE